MPAVFPMRPRSRTIRAHAHAGSLNCVKSFKARSKSVSHLESHSKPSKSLLKRLLRSKVAQGRFYGPDATPHDLGDNPIRSEFNYTLENRQRTKLEETFYFDHDGDGGQTTPDVAKTTTYDWVYDANDRLLSETIDHHDDALNRTESFVMDLFGNRTNRTVDYVDPTAVDQAFAYSYDDNDRLVNETLDNGADSTVDTTTRYSWDHTQQTAKEIFTGDSTAPADLVSSQTFGYDLQGRLAEVITSPETGPATKVTYTYDSSGIRVSSSQFTDTNTSGVFETSELDHTIEYLVDHRNHTGYAQTIAETTTDGNGDNVSRITTTFGTDELSQTTYTPDPATSDAWLAEAMHIFGHDAHGSVRVLLDALGEIAQTFTYAAYGELLAIYDSTGTLVGTLGAADTSAALTNLLYSGESFDSRIGQQYLRARWYNATAGRFSRLDPYFGKLKDPLSFNKYNYVHSDPIQGTDPTGKFLAGLISVGIGSFNRIKEAGVKTAARYTAGLTLSSIGGAITGMVIQNITGGISWSSTGVGSYYGAVLGAGLYIARSQGTEKFAETIASGIITGAMNTAFSVSRDFHEFANPYMGILQLNTAPEHQPAHLLGGSHAEFATSTIGVGFQNFFQGFAIGVWNEATELFDNDGVFKELLDAGVNFVDTFVNAIGAQVSAGQSINYASAFGLGVMAAATDFVQASMPDIDDGAKQIVAGAIVGAGVSFIEASLEVGFGIDIFDADMRFSA